MHYDFNIEYTTLKFSGDFHILSNDSIRYGLVQYYELGYAYYKAISENHKDYVENELLDYLAKTITLDSVYLYNPKIVEEKLKDDEFNNYIKNQIMCYSRNYKLLI